MAKLLFISDMEIFDAKLHDVIEGLRDKRVVCITTAARGEDFPEWMPKQIKPLQEKAKSFVEFDLYEKSSIDVNKALSGADIIYVMGGNTYFLLEHIQKSGFSSIVKSKLNEGAIYIGASAGAAVACPRVDYIEDLDDPKKAELLHFNALGLVDFLIMPHLNHVGMRDKIAKILTKIKNTNESIFGLNEDQGLLIDNSYMRVI